MKILVLLDGVMPGVMLLRAATVILAMGAGKNEAKSIDLYLKNKT